MKEYLKPEISINSFVQMSGIAADDTVEEGIYEGELELSTPIPWWPETI